MNDVIVALLLLYIVGLVAFVIWAGIDTFHEVRRINRLTREIEENTRRINRETERIRSRRQSHTT